MTSLYWMAAPPAETGSIVAFVPIVSGPVVCPVDPSEPTVRAPVVAVVLRFESDPPQPITRSAMSSAINA